jgi:hypothetical protein
MIMSKRPSSFLILLALLIPMVGLPTVAAALDNSSVDFITHVAQCAQWMVTDPAKHAKYCSPSHVGAVFASAGGDGNAQTSESTSSESTSVLSISIP